MGKNEIACCICKSEENGENTNNYVKSPDCECFFHKECYSALLLVRLPQRFDIKKCVVCSKPVDYKKYELYNPYKDEMENSESEICIENYYPVSPSNTYYFPPAKNYV